MVVKRTPAYQEYAFDCGDHDVVLIGRVVSYKNESDAGMPGPFGYSATEFVTLKIQIKHAEVINRREGTRSAYFPDDKNIEASAINSEKATTPSNLNRSKPQRRISQNKDVEIDAEEIL